MRWRPDDDFLEGQLKVMPEHENGRDAFDFGKAPSLRKIVDYDFTRAIKALLKADPRLVLFLYVDEWFVIPFLKRRVSVVRE